MSIIFSLWITQKQAASWSWPTGCNLPTPVVEDEIGGVVRRTFHQKIMGLCVFFFVSFSNEI